MTIRWGVGITLGLAIVVGEARADDPVRKSVAYLAVEVPSWARENRCYSCHNNGDAARALFRAKAAGLGFGADVLTDTTSWLARPEAWDKKGDDGPPTDKRLARIEFALALATAIDTNFSRDRNALRRAADLVAADQGADGCWPVEDGGAIGTPATYGRRLATAMAVEVLRRDDPIRHAGRIAKAVAWLRSQSVDNVVEAAAVLLAEPSGRATDRSDAAKSGLAFLIKAQTRSGGWGPYRESPVEPFDTALALLAMEPYRSEPDVGPAIDRGRAALVALQRADGSWPETTRPAGGESYAQRLSTTGWATLALLATRR
jgi:hypothetical protein